MTELTWPTTTDDSGTLTDGTIIDQAYFYAIRDTINNKIHSTTNPTITPEDIIDEVVTARGTKASLDARLDVEHNNDGTHNLSASIVTTTVLDDAIGAQNRCLNGKFETWTNGASSAPDSFTLAGTGAAVARTGVGESDTTRKVGKYAAKITYGSATASLTQIIIAAADYDQFDYVEGTNVTAQLYIYSTTVNKCRAALYDGNVRTYFDNETAGSGTYHTGGGTWEEFRVTHPWSAAGSKLDVELYVEGAGNGVFSGVTVTLCGTEPGRYIERPSAAAQHLTLATDSELINERVFTPSGHLEATDAGAGSTYTVISRPTTTDLTFWDDFFAYDSSGLAAGAQYGQGWEIYAANNGSASTPTASVASHPGTLLCITSATTNGLAGVKGGEAYTSDIKRLVWVIKTPATVSSLQIVAGIIDNATGATDGTAEGIYFWYSAAASANWRAVTHDGSATNTDSTVAVGTATWYQLEIRINSAYNSITFYINGTLRATHTTNIPTAGGLDVFLCAVRSTTTSDRTMVIDYFSAQGHGAITRY